VRELSGYRLQVTPVQWEQLALVFSDDKGEVDYPRFASEIAKVSGTSPSGGDIEKILDYLRLTARHRHSQVQESVALADKDSLGVLPAARFFRILQLQGFRLSDEERELVEAEFTDGDGGIRYDELFNVILPATPSSAASYDSVIIRLKKFLSAKRLYLKPQLEKADRKRSGIVTVTDLLGALRALSFDLTPVERRIVKSQLGSEVRGRINISAFCDDVDPPPSSPADSAAFTNEEAVVPPDDVLTALEALTAIDQSGRADLDNEFRIRDFHRRGDIPRSQFEPLLVGLGIKAPVVATLATYYSNSPRFVQYQNLLRDQSLFAPAPPREQPPLRPEAVAALTRIKRAIATRGLDLEAGFLKYDAGRVGTIDSGRLRPAFDAVGYRIAVGDEDILKKSFAQAGNDTKVDYRRLIEAVEEAIGEDPENKDDGETRAIVESLHARIQARRRKVRDGFFGKEPEGISEDDFREVLGKYVIALREPDVVKLVKAYRRRDGNIDWQRFCDDVEAVKSNPLV
jgi:Ca2+-binding EF-hand superfamily protein